MTLSDLEWLRLRIMDRPHVALRETVGRGDGAETLFQTQLMPVVADSETVIVGGVAQVPGVNYALDADTGLLTFTTIPADGAEVVVTYEWVTFTDDELNEMLARYGNVTRSAIIALETLLADTERFIKYSFGQESVDRSALREAIADLVDRLRADKRALPSLVKATTACRRELLYPFIQQTAESCGY